MIFSLTLWRIEMKKKFIAGLATGLFMLGMSGIANALIIDTNAGWDGNINSGWLGSGQSLTVDAADTYFDSIGFYFADASLGNTYDFILSDALNGGNTLFSTSFSVTGGINVININQDMTANSMIYALLDYNGFNGQTAHFSYSDTYAGGNSSFGPIGSQDSASFAGLDHRFVAEFSNGSAPVPEPTTILLFGVGLAGLIGSRIKRKK
jgi:hypothetical protein